MVDHGGARHLYYLSPAQVSTVVRLNWAIQPFPIVGFCTGKISTALLILRFMSPNTRWRKWFLYISIGVSIVCTTLAVIFLFVQCSPPKALWEEVEGAQCWNPKVVSNYQIANASRSYSSAGSWSRADSIYNRLECFLRSRSSSVAYHHNLELANGLEEQDWAMFYTGLGGLVSGITNCTGLAEFSSRLRDHIVPV